MSPTQFTDILFPRLHHSASQIIDPDQNPPQPLQILTKIKPN